MQRQVGKPPGTARSSITRRTALAALAALAAGGACVAVPRLCLGARASLLAEPVRGLLSAEFGSRMVSEDTRIVLDITDRAENGAVVPLTVHAPLAGIRSICVYVTANPSPLTAAFEPGEGALGEISTRIKITDNSQVIAVVATEHGLYGVAHDVEVTLGACAG